MTHLSQVGGIFSILVFWHFVADWVFQTHREALAKSKNLRLRFQHCAEYTFMYSILFWYIGFDNNLAWRAAGLLFVSHFIIDSYVPVMLWAKYFRKAPQFDGVVKKFSKPTETEELTNGQWKNTIIDKITYASDEEAFIAYVSTPIGLVLMITMDQLFHITFLLPIAYMIMRP